MITLSAIAPRKMRCYKVVAIRVKTNPQILAARRLLFPRYATKKILIGFRVVVKSAGSEKPVFTFCIWVRYSMDYSFKTVDFQAGKRVREH
jgi:hypothetical protein